MRDLESPDIGDRERRVELTGAQADGLPLLHERVERGVACSLLNPLDRARKESTEVAFYASPVKRMPGVGLEPTQAEAYEILSLARLPFRHPGWSSFGREPVLDHFEPLR